MKWSALWLACALAGCRQPGVLVEVDTADAQAIAGVYKLTGTVDAGGMTGTFDVKDGGGRFLVPPPAQRFELVFGAASRGLDATLLVQAVATDGTTLASGQAAFNTGQSQTVEVRLGQGVTPPPDMSPVCIVDAGQTDVGCGGPSCPPCAVDQKCVLPTDCRTNTCVQGICARAELSWVAVSALPMQRSNLAAVQTSDGRLWALGGFHQNAQPQGQRADVDSYDPYSDQWTAEASMKKPRSGLCAAALPGGGIAVAGGYVDVTGFASKTVEYYDPVAKTWTLGTHALNQGRTAAAMVAIGGGLLIMGGETDNVPPVSSITSVETQAAPVSTASQWTNGTAMTRGLELYPAVAFGSNALVLGGDSTTDSNAWEPLVSVWSGTAWSDDSARLIAGRNGHAAVVGADGRIFVIGGNVNPGVVTGAVETYDPVLHAWAAMKAQIRPRDRLAAALGPDGRIYAVGGSNNGLEVDFVDAYVPSIAFAPAAAS
ncbi:MAG: Kelch repeat-containing protein, partial [Polyangia bacterium]